MGCQSSNMVPIGPARDFVIVGLGLLELDDLARPLVAGQHRALAAENANQADQFFRSDHLSFAGAAPVTISPPMPSIPNGTCAASCPISRCPTAWVMLWRPVAAGRTIASEHCFAEPATARERLSRAPEHRSGQPCAFVGAAGRAGEIHSRSCARSRVTIHVRNTGAPMLPSRIRSST